MSLKSDDGANVSFPSRENDTVDDTQPMSDGKESEAAADTEAVCIGPRDQDGWYTIERPGRMETRFRTVDFDSHWRIQISGSTHDIEGTLHFDIDRKYDGFEEKSWMAEVDDNVREGEDSEYYYDNIKDAVEDTYWITTRESQTQMENEVRESLRLFHKSVLVEASPEWKADMDTYGNRESQRQMKNKMREIEGKFGGLFLASDWADDMGL
ncbi:hypothetical protein B9479_006715 [Cryptococcus floricola]|uniref:Uncharacterized protein n=1 Tax=Cryptococcus floricola TaxID=2591691 RepID=A0A5D3ASE2_9TREE|nr:hypothetical protein B9479_006715 [Cryptococcus floricola]